MRCPRRPKQVVSVANRVNIQTFWGLNKVQCARNATRAKSVMVVPQNVEDANLVKFNLSRACPFALIVRREHLVAMERSATCVHPASIVPGTHWILRDVKNAPKALHN